MKKYLTTWIFALCAICCAAQNTYTGKPKYLWFDAEANFKRFATKDSITYYLEKAKKTGFNRIVVDIRPIYGEVLYKSKYFPQLTKARNQVVTRDWDYLQYFIDEARRLNLRVTASATLFTAGDPVSETGLLYDDKSWSDKVCLQYKPDGTMTDIRYDKSKVSVFTNPVRKDVRKIAMKMIREIVKNYDIDGFALDYCRFADAENDFSPVTRKAFERYLGKKVENFPDDIFTYNADGTHNPGKYYNSWWAFRAKIISDFVKEASKAIKNINPKTEVEYWAAAWVYALYVTGQNWASPDVKLSSIYPHWGSPEYDATGFAPYLDNFLLGTYMETIFGLDNPESIEYGIARAKKVINGDCHVLGTIFAPNHKSNIADAVKVCLTQSEGLMVFDIVQVIELNLWDDISRGIREAESVQ